jgi:hypothetical protein
MNGYMFVIWGTRGDDCRELPVSELRDEAHTTEAIIRKLDEAFASLQPNGFTAPSPRWQKGSPRG